MTTRTTRRGFLGLLLGAAAWSRRPVSIGRKLYPAMRFVSEYKYAFRPQEYYGKWKFVVHESDKL